MRVVIPVLDFGRSGGYRALARLASEWSRTREVMFVAPYFAADPYYPTDARTLHVDLVGRQRPQAHRGLSGVSRVSMAQTALVLGLRRNTRAGDVVLSNHFLTTLAANTLVGGGTTHVRYMQATEADYYPGNSVKARSFRALAKIADTTAPFVLVNSPEFLVGSPRRIGVIPPGLDDRLFRPECRDRSDGLTIGTIGRAESWKGTDQVLSALRMVNLPESTRIHVANFGADLTPFRDLPLVESQPRDDSELARWYRRLDFYVVGAYGQPGAYHYPCLEALACGVALVTPWYRPADEGNSWIADSSDPSALADRIRAAIADAPERARRRDAGLTTAQLHPWPRVAATALELIEAAAEARPGRPPGGT